MTFEEYAALPWEDVESSNMARIAFVDETGGDPEADRGSLFVEFHGGRVYAYRDVPVTTVEELREAESVGGYLNAEIKPAYACERVSVA
jgi:hypothetical protein